MQLTTAQTQAVERQTNLVAITQDYDAFDKLQKTFGKHTYFTNEQGLFIFKKADDESTTARMRVFAVWSEENGDTLLRLEEPEDANLILDLESTELFQLEATPPTQH